MDRPRGLRILLVGLDIVVLAASLEHGIHRDIECFFATAEVQPGTAAFQMPRYMPASFHTPLLLLAATRKR